MDEDIRTKVLQRAAEMGGRKPSEIDGETTLESLGLDSADAVILAMEIEEATGQVIDVGIFLRFETLEEAAAEIANILNNPTSPASAPIDGVKSTEAKDGT